MKLWWQLASAWIKAHKGITLLSLFLALTTVFAGIGLLSVAGWFLTGAFLAGSTISFNLFAPSALVRGLSLLRIVSRYMERVTGHIVTLDLQAEIRTQSFARLAAFKPAQLAQYRDGDLLSRLISDTERLDTFFLLIITPVFTAGLAGGFFSWVMGVNLPAMGWSMLIVLLLSAAVLPYFLAKRTANAGVDVQAAQADLRAIAHDAIAAHTDLLVFDAISTAQAQFNTAGLRLAQAQKRMANAGSFGTLMQQLLMGGLVLTLLWLGANAHVEAQITAPMWVGLLLGAMGLFEVLAPIMRGAAGLGAVQAAAARIQELNRNLAQAPAHPTAAQSTVNALAVPFSGNLTIENITVSYGAETVLSDLSLHIEQGQRIAIQGLSGAGKTTLLMAIMQVQALGAGRICYGDVDLAEVDSTELYQRFSLLSQHSPVFMGTVRHNLLLAAPQASDEELWAALQQVRLAEHITAIGGLDAWVGEGGNTLSTGQVRRLSLARTVLSAATVWLLDEPTSGLDKATADAWFTDLQHVAAGRTVIIVTHATLPEGVVDQSLQLQNGILNT